MGFADGRRVVVLAHRAPITFGRDDDGRLVAGKAGGGLVSALTAVSGGQVDMVWVAAAASDEDRARAEEAQGQALPIRLAPTPKLLEHDEGHADLALRLVAVDPIAHERFYGVIANPLLWFLQHSLYGLAEEPNLTTETWDAYRSGYVAVNDLFAAVVAEELATGKAAVALIQDYHFYLVPGRLRELVPDAAISLFVHIPWPGPDSWRVLPAPMREQLLSGVLGADVVGFHTSRYARNFVLSAQELLDAEVNLETLTVKVAGRTVAARAYPIAADLEGLRSLAGSDEVATSSKELAGLVDGRSMVLRVDRTDPSKNIVRGFRAFGQLLDDHPELAGQVWFLALLQPSRQDVPEYADYVARIGAAAAEVNARHSHGGRQPVDLRLVENQALAVAAYKICDVIFVNAVADGMNLVAKEALLISERDAVAVLSETTGAHHELGPFAVTVSPFDISDQAAGLHRALTMDHGERAERHAKAVAAIESNTPAGWLAAQLDALTRD